MPKPSRSRSPRPDLGARGYLYLIQFDNGVVKAGKTTDVAARLSEHEREAARYDITIVNRWTSLLHDHVAIVERRLVAVLGAIGKNTRAGREYFSGVPFSVARHQAANIDKVTSERCCCGKCVEPLVITRLGALVTGFAEGEVTLRLECGSVIRADFPSEDTVNRSGFRFDQHQHIEVELEPTPFDDVWTAYYLG